MLGFLLFPKTPLSRRTIFIVMADPGETLPAPAGGGEDCR